MDFIKIIFICVPKMSKVLTGVEKHECELFLNELNPLNSNTSINVLLEYLSPIT